MEIRAHAQEHAPGGHGREISLLQAVVRLEQVLDAISLGAEFATAKNVDVNLTGRRLIPTNEMTGQANANNRQPHAAGQKEVNAAHAERIAAPAVHHPI